MQTLTGNELSIAIRRVRANVIEYDLIFHTPFGDETRTQHANREATFAGPWTGNPARQLTGGAFTHWRADDADMLMAFRRFYGNRIVNISLA